MRLDPKQTGWVGEHRPGVRLGKALPLEDLQKDPSVLASHVGLIGALGREIAEVAVALDNLLGRPAADAELQASAGNDVGRAGVGEKRGGTRTRNRRNGSRSPGHDFRVGAKQARADARADDHERPEQRRGRGGIRAAKRAEHDRGNQRQGSGIGPRVKARPCGKDVLREHQPDAGDRDGSRECPRGRARALLKFH